MDLDILYSGLRTNAEGLTGEQAAERLEDNGPNAITASDKETSWTRLYESVVNPFNMVLIFVAIIALITDVVFADQQDYTTFIIVTTLIVVASVISFAQSEKSGRAAEKLAKMIVNRADVKRDGEFVAVLMEELVTGDVIKLAAGDMIPADVRFLTTKDLFVAQSSLTGESNPVEKFADVVGEGSEAITDLANIGFMGSDVVSGTATAVIISTGDDTYFGSMAQTLSGKAPKNSFERGIDSVGKLLMKFVLTMVPVIIVINILTNVNPIDSVLFAIAIAVGIMPEMLPVIFTSTLAVGAVQMSKHKVIVKNTGSIQTFGEMDILCTDKTGTLTEDKIVLEKYLNINGEEDGEVLKRAYLNSYFQTSLKNMIDLAVIHRAQEEKLNELAQQYTLADEVPYDFNRRRMSVVLDHESSDNHIITKGSFEEVMSVCQKVKYGGKVIALTEKIRREAAGIYDKYSNRGFRILAVAEKETDLNNQKAYGVADEADMTLVGFIGFVDPPKESAKKAVKALVSHGVRNVVLTGDSRGVAVIVCERVGIDAKVTVSGAEVEAMSDRELAVKVEKCNLFYKLSPVQKERVVKSLQSNGHTVGYMGDGINDAMPLKQSDVGISVDNAVDIAKETANIILLEKDLLVLEKGVVLGRRTFGNIMKYVKMTTSGNFGNMFSVVVASIFLPFLPMLPIHILAQNMLCDFSQLGMPFDNVDEKFLRKPRRWDTQSIKTFAYIFGPISSIFDILCFVVLFFVIGANTQELSPLFQGGWFVFGVVSQVLIIYMIRSSQRPFFKSLARVGKPLVLSTLVVTALTLLIGFTDLGAAISIARLPLTFAAWLGVLIVGYALTIEAVKRIYIKKYGQWL
jgi:Mg2+-importing ATPase